MFRLLSETQNTVDIKKSQFIATCVAIDSEEDAKREIERLRHNDATHNCWAWRLGGTYRFSDDGEPGGSAGRPILAAIDGQNFDGVLAHVVRYFGGIKLGVGGLVRAYGGTVAECLRTAEKETVIARDILRFCVDFSDTYAVYGLMTQKNLIKVSEEYTAGGVRFELSAEAAEIEEIRAKLNDLTRARIKFEECGAEDS